MKEREGRKLIKKEGHHAKTTTQTRTSERRFPCCDHCTPNTRGEERESEREGKGLSRNRKEGETVSENRPLEQER